MSTRNRWVVSVGSVRERLRAQVEKLKPQQLAVLKDEFAKSGYKWDTMSKKLRGHRQLRADEAAWLCWHLGLDANVVLYGIERLPISPTKKGREPAWRRIECRFCHKEFRQILVGTKDSGTWLPEYCFRCAVERVEIPKRQAQLRAERLPKAEQDLEQRRTELADAQARDDTGDPAVAKEIKALEARLERGAARVKRLRDPEPRTAMKAAKGEAESIRSQDPANPFGPLVIGPSAPERSNGRARMRSLEQLREAIEGNPSVLDGCIDAEFKRAEGPRKGALRLLIKAEKRNVKHEAEGDVPARPNVIARLEAALTAANHEQG